MIYLLNNIFLLVIDMFFLAPNYPDAMNFTLIFGIFNFQVAKSKNRWLHWWQPNAHAFGQSTIATQNKDENTDHFQSNLFLYQFVSFVVKKRLLWLFGIDFMKYDSWYDDQTKPPEMIGTLTWAWYERAIKVPNKTVKVRKITARTRRIGKKSV